MASGDKTIEDVKRWIREHAEKVKWPAVEPKVVMEVGRGRADTKSCRPEIARLIEEGMREHEELLKELAKY